uniref:Uncharacterized protein n=1 Tax=Rhizophora mucronata TaxID=61149 RepID=A0A2P2NG11_RHIMU
MKLGIPEWKLSGAIIVLIHQWLSAAVDGTKSCRAQRCSRRHSCQVLLVYRNYVAAFFFFIKNNIAFSKFKFQIYINCGFNLSMILAT